MKLLEVTGHSKKILVDDEDYERIRMYSWCLSPAGIKATINTKQIQLARFILNYSGPNEIDHKDRDIFNNQKDNLRYATRSQNLANRHTRQSKYGFKGIRKFGNRWHARITVNGKEKHLGTFASDIEAAKAYNIAAINFFGEFAILNEVDNEINT